MKIGHHKDFWGGTLFAVLGLLFAVIARGVPGMAFIPGYSMGTPARMGPGFFPFYLGMLLDGILLIVIASKGSHDFRLKPILILAVSLSIFCALVFVVGLKLPIPLCPDIESLQSAVSWCRA